VLAALALTAGGVASVSNHGKSHSEVGPAKAHLAKKSTDTETSASGARPKKPPTKAQLALKHNRQFKFPDGSRQLLPNYRLVALYGTPGAPALGALGEQSLPATIKRVKKLAASYQPLSAQPVMPALEIIASVASGSPTNNGNYSREQPASKFEPWVRAARKAGVYVVLDLQSGRSTFLSEAKQYKSLLKQPNVGLALDPEWRLTANEVPLAQIGTVNIKEVNQTVDWLAKLTHKNDLPQKLLLLQQFRLDMITGRKNLDTSHADLAYVIQMDGEGTQSEKNSTWRAITKKAPAGTLFGWKNFYDEDHPMLSPSATMKITPPPFYISYQ
jgi:hypothetical protein